MKTSLRLILLALAACLTAVPGALAQDVAVHRAHQGEFYLLLGYMTAGDQTAPNVTLPIGLMPGATTTTADIHFNVHDELSWGLGYAYHFSDNLSLRAEATFAWPDYDMDFSTLSATGDAYINTGKVNLDYYFGKGKVSPFVSGGIGYMYIDTGVPSGPPEYYYFWDYWWGGTIVGTQPTYTKTYFTYNAAAGIRWDINERAVLKLSFGGVWMDTGHGSGTWSTTETNLTFGWRF